MTKIMFVALLVVSVAITVAGAAEELDEQYLPASTSQPTTKPVVIPVGGPAALRAGFAPGESWLIVHNTITDKTQPLGGQLVKASAEILLVGKLNRPAKRDVPSNAKAKATFPAVTGTLQFQRVAQRRKSTEGPIQSYVHDSGKLGNPQRIKGAAKLHPLDTLLEIVYQVTFSAEGNVVKVTGFDAFFKNRSLKPSPGMAMSFGNEAILLLLQRPAGFLPPAGAASKRTWTRNTSVPIPAYGPTTLKQTFVAQRIPKTSAVPGRREIKSHGTLTGAGEKTTQTQYGSVTVGNLEGVFAGSYGACIQTGRLVSVKTNGTLRFNKVMNITATAGKINVKTNLTTTETFLISPERNRREEDKLFYPKGKNKNRKGNGKGRKFPSLVK